MLLISLIKPGGRCQRSLESRYDLAVADLTARLGLYAICDAGLRPDLSMLEKAERLLDGGVQWLQLRMKGMGPAEAVGLGRKIVARCHDFGCRCLFNDRVDYALICGADGAHVGDEDLPASDARRLLGPARILGVTVRNGPMIEQARRAGADYVGLGPIFPTRTKNVDAAPIGLEGLRTICSQSAVPVVAISGIAIANIRQVASTGASGAAVASDLLSAPDIPAQARRLASEFAKGCQC
jgi:thiamine-phosphate pyrophosphorylase